MTKEQCEMMIIEKMEEIEEIYKQYNPNADYLNLIIRKDVLRFNNSYWVTIDEIGDDVEYPLNYAKYREVDYEV